MPFFQSMAVRFGVKSFLENCGIDEEAAGWLAAGASLATAVVTADLHGHIAGEAVAHGVHHATGHAVSHATSHAVSHGSNHATSHLVSQNHGSLMRNGSAMTTSGWDDVINDNGGNIYNDALGNPIPHHHHLSPGDHVRITDLPENVHHGNIHDYYQGKDLVHVRVDGDAFYLKHSDLRPHDIRSR